MGEIQQTAGIEQKNIVVKAGRRTYRKEKAAQDATTLIQLDAMKIQIVSIRQQYLKKALMVENNPQEKVATMYRSSLGYSIKLKSEEDVDQYVADIKEKLMELLHAMTCCI